MQQINCMRDIVQCRNSEKLDAAQTESPRTARAQRIQGILHILSGMPSSGRSSITFQSYMNDITLISVSQHVYMNYIYLSRS